MSKYRFLKLESIWSFILRYRDDKTSLIINGWIKLDLSSITGRLVLFNIISIISVSLRGLIPLIKESYADNNVLKSFKILIFVTSLSCALRLTVCVGEAFEA